MPDPILDLDSFVPYRLSVTSNAVSDVIARAYRERFGLRVTEWRVVAILAQSPGLTPAAIGVRARLDKIGVSRAAAALLARGLIEAEANPHDRRSHRLELTAAGQELYREIVPAARALEAKIVAGLSAAEITVLDCLLRRIETAATA